MRRDQLAGANHIGGRLHEAEGDDVDAVIEAEAQILDVLRGHRRRRQLDARKVDPLVLAERTAVQADGGDRLAVARFNAQFDAAIVEQQTVARPDGAPQICEGGRDAARVSDTIVAGDDVEPLAGLEIDGLTILQLARPDFWTAEVLQDRDVTARAPGGVAYARDGFRMLIVRAMREVQAEDIDPGSDQFFDPRFFRRRRSERGDNLGQAMHNA